MEAISAAGAAVTVGSAVAGLIPTHRECNIEITNKSSKYSLTNSRMYTHRGSCARPLTLTIEPSGTGDAQFKKTPHTARGSAGVFAYDLLNRSTNQVTKKMAVTFAVPYDYNLYSNWYAVGIFDRSKECNQDLYNQINKNKSGSYVKGKASGPPLSYINDRVKVAASMTDTYQPVMKVEVSDV